MVCIRIKILNSVRYFKIIKILVLINIVLGRKKITVCES